ncbi:MAG: signal peptidase I [Dysgonamonadaceae bacterium]|nr:signal peptidase I [Dysgonamonadaceae bacterium]
MAKFSWKKFWKDLVVWTLVSIIAIVLAIAMRVFLFCSFKIPSCSMSPAIIDGDFVAVNKQIPGPRIYPHFPKTRIDGRAVTKRFRGIRAVRRNDVLVFNFPYSSGWEKIDMDLGVNYIKRCVAIPGDTFCIENGIYMVKNAPDAILGCRDHQTTMSEMPETNYNRAGESFPRDSVRYGWTVRNFGQLYVPKKGDTLVIDTLNYVLYKNLIAYETDKPVDIRDGQVLLGDSSINQYVFTMNYYFMAGDYIFDSIDSRYWGLLPEDHIVGKAVLIWKSMDLKTGKRRWNRYFKSIK